MDVHTRREQRKKTQRMRKSIFVVTLFVIAASAVAILRIKHLEKKSNVSKSSMSQVSAAEKDKTKEKTVEVENKSSTDSENTNTNSGDTGAIGESDSNQVVASNPVSNLKEFFKKDIFLGDSISEGLSYYGVINEANVVATKGINITRAKNEVNKMAKVNPKNIYILFGVNDMNDSRSNQWFIDQYAELIQTIKGKFPNAHIYIQSIMPVLPKVEQRMPHINNRHINECNAALAELAKKEKVGFINIASLINDSTKNLYEGDGIHFKAAFYPVWLNYVASSVKK